MNQVVLGRKYTYSPILRTYYNWMVICTHTERAGGKWLCTYMCAYINALRLWCCSKCIMYCIRMNSMQKEMCGWLIWLGDICSTACCLTALCCFADCHPAWTKKNEVTVLVSAEYLGKGSSDFFSFFEKTNSEKKHVKSLWVISPPVFILWLVNYGNYN